MSQIEKKEYLVKNAPYNIFYEHSHKLILPEATPNANPSWFGFLITVKKDAGITRNELVQKLDAKKIATRLLFAGDLRKQPYFKDYDYRIVGDLPNTDIIVSDTFWIGVTPMINNEMMAYMISSFDEILG